MTALLQTEVLTFQGMNIRGNPKMRTASVVNDLEILESESDSAVVCEFRWADYWRAAKRLFGNEAGDRFGAYPGFKVGERFPVASGQASFWRTSVFEKEKGRATLCHLGHAGISEMRMIRGTLLNHLRTGLKHWEVVAHFVVGGDGDGDGPIRKKILRNNIRRFVRFLKKLKRTGHAILGQLDANIHQGTWAFREFMSKMKNLGATFHGELGIEYLFSIDGEKSSVNPVKSFVTLPEHKGGVLKTDHEARGLTYRLYRKAAL